MKTATAFKDAGKLVYNYVTAHFVDQRVGKAVLVDGQSIWVDDSRPITLQRMRELHRFCSEATGETLGEIKINMSAYDAKPEEADLYEWGIPKLWDKTYIYNPRTNSLTIWENGEPVYANEGGVICTDKAAMWDSLN